MQQLWILRNIRRELWLYALKVTWRRGKAEIANGEELKR